MAVAHKLFGRMPHPEKTMSARRADAARRHLTVPEPDVALHIRDLRALVALHQPLLHGSDSDYKELMQDASANQMALEKTLFGSHSMHVCSYVPARCFVR